MKLKNCAARSRVSLNFKAHQLGWLKNTFNQINLIKFLHCYNNENMTGDFLIELLVFVVTLRQIPPELLFLMKPDVNCQAKCQSEKLGK